ncbi:MAG: cobalamin B12-binding domain-containing protein [ANME-2 cluster archaeon]|nr:cobalamin B12-binding domain-containing protein [ANME-2 cluster archaeon]MBC2702546.1 cobalamin B12-binding domain-containing protein [ANME-2 cluster archaeon]
MPVKHQVAILNKKTTSLQVPLSLLALARMVKQDFNISIVNAVTDLDYTGQIPDACQDALCFAVSSMTCYQIRDGLNVCAAVREQYPDLPIIWGGYHPSPPA